MQLKTSLILLVFFLSTPVLAENTGKGKVLFTQGHINPACRTVGFQARGSNDVQYFRIANVQGDDDVNAVLLAAMMANREVDIHYVANVTTGCGPEPGIDFITVY
jgi:hypothetical protein